MHTLYCLIAKTEHALPRTLRDLWLVLATSGGYCANRSGCTSLISGTMALLTETLFPDFRVLLALLLAWDKPLEDTNTATIAEESRYLSSEMKHTPVILPRKTCRWHRAVPIMASLGCVDRLLIPESQFVRDCQIKVEFCSIR